MINSHESLASATSAPMHIHAELDFQNRVICSYSSFKYIPLVTFADSLCAFPSTLTSCEKLWENQSDESDLGSRFNGSFTEWGPRSPWAPGEQSGAWFWARWAPGFKATSRSTVGGAQVPRWVLPLESFAAASNQPPPLTLSTQRACFWAEMHTDLNNYEERAILGGRLLAHPVRRR